MFENASFSGYEPWETYPLKQVPRPNHDRFEWDNDVIVIIITVILLLILVLIVYFYYKQICIFITDISGLNCL